MAELVNEVDPPSGPIDQPVRTIHCLMAIIGKIFKRGVGKPLILNCSLLDYTGKPILRVVESPVGRAKPIDRNCLRQKHELQERKIRWYAELYVPQSLIFVLDALCGGVRVHSSV